VVSLAFGPGLTLCGNLLVKRLCSDPQRPTEAGADARKPGR
jgi:hypothetical protein